MTPEDIVAGLDEMLASLCSAHIFPVIIRQFCMQIFYWMDTCLFNLLAKADVGPSSNSPTLSLLTRLPIE